MSIAGAKFRQQVQKAKRLNTGISGSIARNEYDHVRDFTRSDEFNRLADVAYNTPRGYAISVIDGKKVMYVSGSRNIYDWVFNAAGAFVPNKYHMFSNKTTSRLNTIARQNDVDIVVGHSRGAKLVSGMHGNFRKFGLDGAMMLARKQDRDMMNLAQKQPLDRMIARGGRNNKFYRVKRPMRSHFLSRDYRGYEQQYYRRGRHADKYINPFFNPYS